MNILLFKKLHAKNLENLQLLQNLCQDLKFQVSIKQQLDFDKMDKQMTLVPDAIQF